MYIRIDSERYNKCMIGTRNYTPTVIIKVQLRSGDGELDTVQYIESVLKKNSPNHSWSLTFTGLNSNRRVKRWFYRFRMKRKGLDPREL